jgi:hypothetical protein
MKNSIKRFGIIALVAIIGFTMTACKGDPEDNNGRNDDGVKTFGDFKYTVRGNAVAIVGYTVSETERVSERSVEIPSEIDEKPVSIIDQNVFAGKQLTSVTIPNSVTIIGGGAFCKNQLTIVTIPDSVTIICNSAFSENQLTSVTIGANVTLDYYNNGFSAVSMSFDKIYNDGGKVAGTYTRPNTDSNDWAKQ